MKKGYIAALLSATLIMAATASAYAEPRPSTAHATTIDATSPDSARKASLRHKEEVSPSPISGLTVSGNSTKATAPVIKGTWLSYVDMEDLLKNKDQKTFDSTFGSICKTLHDNGGNAIFVHVRSHNDAIYPSTVYPWSCHMLSGMDPGYDPLSDMVKIAHENKLAIHAWINPYGYRNGVISEHPELSNATNIFAGVAEILGRYDIDGIHFDDYFPPLGATDINAMIAQVHQMCLANGKLFGIAPQGNIQNNVAMGADVATWLSKKEYIDYIAPQIYWTDNYGASGTQTMSTDRLAEWKKLNKAGIPMYVGMALYRAGNAIAGDPGWSKQSDNLKKQAEKAKALGYRGYILYNTKSQMQPNEAQKTEIKKLNEVEW